LARAVDKEADQNIPYELSEVFYDWTLLGKETEGDQEQNKVLLVAARHEVIDSRVQITDAAEVPVHVFGVDSLALADAAEACDFLRTGESVALINIGASGASIHFTKDGLSNYVREVGWGAREMIQAIIKLRRCDYNQAETLLKGIGESEQGDPGAGDAAPSASEDDAHAATEGDQEPQEAPASLLDPLDEELADLEDMPASTTPAKPAPENGGDDLRGALKIPLARLANEVRRSFDYYEQQMYETQIDRVILSGGPAHMPLIRKALADELGMEHVEVADPASSALLVRDERNLQPLLDQPAQYMVAIGLAARGTAEL
jgi:type IV pilus assembly protein PilM